MLEGQSSLLDRSRETKRVTLVGAVLNLIMAVVKIGFGLVAQSQSLLADGIHSLSDLLSDGLVYAAAHHAHHGPDSKHPYGHGRFETAATLGLAFLLILVGAGIAWDASDHLFSPEELLQPGLLALVVALFSIFVNEWLYHYTMRVARCIQSDMLRANAWHHRSDAVSSIVVLVGVGGTMAGLPYLDAVAAVAVGLMIGRIGWDLGKRALEELVDVGLEEERVEKIRGIIHSIGGVLDIHMLRTRRMGGQASVDVHVLVEPRLSVSEGHMISQTVIDWLQVEFSEICDVTVHIDPEDDEMDAPTQDLPLRDAALELLDRQWEGIPDVEQREQVVLHYLKGQIDVDVYFPLQMLRDESKAEILQSALQQGLEGLSEFGGVQVYFG